MRTNHFGRRFSVEGSAGGTCDARLAVFKCASSDVQSYAVAAKSLAKVAEVEVMTHGFHE